MTKATAYKPLFKEIKKQLGAYKISIKRGAIIDASFINTSLKPEGKTSHKVTEDRANEQKVEVTKEYVGT
jgi:IS5 family transposase